MPKEKTGHPPMRVRLQEHIRKNKSVFVVYVVLRILVLASLVSACLRGEWESAGICVLVLVLFMLPTLVQRNFGIELPSALEIIILCFIFAAEILGELQNYFIQYPHWDTLLHTTNGFLCAGVGFSLVSILNRNQKVNVRLSPLFLALVAFCFSMTVGVVWEFFEFASDRLTDSDMQKDTVVHKISSVMLDETNSNIPIVVDSIDEMTVNGQDLGLGGYLDIGLYDTMEDLFVNFIGAVVFSTFGFFYVKGKGKTKFVRNFIPRVAGAEEDLPPQDP